MCDVAQERRLYMNIIETNLGFGSLSYRKTTTRIIIHHADAASCTIQDIHRWHINNGWAGCGYHFFVRKDGSIYRGRPENAVGAHASGSNSDSIGICFEGDYAAETMSDAQKQAGKELVAYLKNKYKIDKVLGHRDVCATSCPGNNFPFAEIAGVPTSSVTVNESAVTVAKSGQLKVDGWWGPKTTTRLQKIFGTTVDGIVSNQFTCYKDKNPGLDGGWEWKDKPSGYSPLIKAIQKWCGATEDGHIGPNTITAIQKKLGCGQDGCFSGPSPCIRKFQEWCNNQ